MFNGKLNWFQYASNETITVVFPTGFALNDPVSAHWQWTADGNDSKKARARGCCRTPRAISRRTTSSRSRTTCSGDGRSTPHTHVQSLEFCARLCPPCV
ncbi:hypothetical protein V8D89_003882 [Ganoderma adspersum]